jgi:hypothetical protein
MRGPISPAVLLAAVSIRALASTACGPAPDVGKAVQIADVTTGWFDAGITNGQNKLVPSVTFKLKNVSNEPVTVLQANVLFHRVNSAEEWGDGFLKVTGTEGLAPGATTDPLVVKSPLGYTSDAPRADMLKNAQFVDAKVRILAKSGSGNWTPLGEYPIERRLLTPGNQ